MGLSREKIVSTLEQDYELYQNVVEYNRANWYYLIVFGIYLIGLIVIGLNSGDNYLPAVATQLIMLHVFLYCMSDVSEIEILLYFLVSGEKESIKEEVKEFYVQNPPQTKDSIKANLLKKNFKFPEYKDLESWCENNLGTSRAIKQIVHKYTIKNQSGIYDKSIVVWRELIPASLINENLLIELIRSIKIDPVYGSVEEIPRIDDYFSQYSEKQIKNLYSVNFSGQKLIDVYRKYSQRTKEPFPVVSRMIDLISYLEFYSEMNGGNVQFRKPLVDLTCETPELVIERVRDVKSLYIYANEFRNCAKTYVNSAKKGEVDFYIVKQEQPMMFHVDNSLRIKEIKYKANAAVSDKEVNKIQNYIKERAKLAKHK